MNAPEATQAKRPDSIAASLSPEAAARYHNLPRPPQFAAVEEERLHRKQRLVTAFRLFSKFGFDEGVAGHITTRDPEYQDSFWVDPFGVHFSRVMVSNLIRCDRHDSVAEGDYPVNAAAFAIHSRMHQARPDAVATAHSHSTYGRAWSTLGRRLSPLTQGVYAFYGGHVVYGDFSGVVVELDEGQRIAEVLGDDKAAILQNHGLLTVDEIVDEAAQWFITMRRSYQVQLLAEAATIRTGEAPRTVSDATAHQAYSIVGSVQVGWFQFQPLYARIIKERPDLLG